MRRIARLVNCLIVVMLSLVAWVPAHSQAFVNCNSGVVCALPTLLTFSQPNGTTSALQNVTVYNGLTTNVTISSVSSNAAQFTVTGTTPMTLTPGQFATYQVQFAPTTAKTYNAKLTFTMTGTTNQIVNLSGVGQNVSAIPTLSTTSVDFGDQALGTNGSQSVTIANTGTASVKVTAVTVTPPFSQTGWTASTTIAAGKSLTLNVSYKPTNLGATTGMIYFTYDVAPNNAVSLWGNGVAAAALGIDTFSALPAATQGALYEANLNAAGGTPPYLWSLASGSSLPSGLTLSSAGIISGTVSSTATLQTYSFNATVTDATNASSTAAFTVTVSKTTGASCSNTVFNGSNGLPLVPLMDLGTALYNNSESGGLYANGSNTDDPNHRAFGQGAAAQIQPLDGNGNPDPNGKIVLLGVGLSVTQQAWAQFVPMAMTDPAKNPNLVIVNGATGGATATNLTSTTNNAFWEVMTNDYLPNAGVTPQQVEGVFFMDLDGGPSGTFPKDMTTLQSQFETITRNLLTLFPNVKIAYLSSVYYMGYSVGLKQKLDPEPWAYEAGFAVKNAIQDQINGVGNLNYDPSFGTVTAPWMAWGPYIWANGMSPRSDGLYWTCQDVQADGTHPANPGGRIKVSSILLNFFKTDDTATPWYLSPSAQAPK